MTEHENPLRMELRFELPGTPEQVWQAIATADGISGWFLPTDLEEREGGAVCFHMGETDSEGRVTGWEPPRRIEYAEPEWAALVGEDPASVTPLVSEFLVEARSGGTCVVHVVSSAFGSGADWEEEFFEQMQETWTPFFDNLRLYLTRFPGQQATHLEAEAQLRGSADEVYAAVLADLGIREVGQQVDARGLRGEVHRLGNKEFLVSLDTSLPGYFGVTTYDEGGEGSALAIVRGWLFSDEADAYVEREQPGWKAWLENLDLESTSTATTAP